jgi:hypothetical protein
LGQKALKAPKKVPTQGGRESHQPVLDDRQDQTVPKARKKRVSKKRKYKKTNLIYGYSKNTTVERNKSCRGLFKGRLYEDVHISDQYAKLKRTYKSFDRNVKGLNPWFQIRNRLRFSTQPIEPWKISKIKSILEGGLVYTSFSIGVRVGKTLRLVKGLTPHGMRFLISRLPFWATSYSSRDVALLDHYLNGRSMCFDGNNRPSSRLGTGKHVSPRFGGGG